jgi:predicted lipoprotein with Yx(FWY)xxD motif
MCRFVAAHSINQPNEDSMKPLSAFSILLMSMLAAGCASIAIAAPAQTADGILTNGAGMTLYTFDRDTADKSACNGPCAANWPPLMAQDGDKATGDYTVISRDDGSKQWALKGRPLYSWSKDQKPGDKTGDGFNNNLWHVAKP